MNKSVKGLLVTALVLSAQSAYASHTNKTFLQPRNQGLVNLPLEMTTFQERFSAKPVKGWGSHLEATVFGGMNTNKNGLGRYFGINNDNKIDLFLGTNPLQLTTKNGTFDVGYIIHDSANAKASSTSVATSSSSATGDLGTLRFSPRAAHAGVDFVYYQSLAKIAKGLYLKINLPVQYVSTDPKLKVDVDNAPTGVLATEENIRNFFKGEDYDASSSVNGSTRLEGSSGNDLQSSSDQELANIVGQTSVDQQIALRAGKINGKRSATGVADIDVMLGYNFVDEEASHAGFNLGMSIPTGKKSTGKYLFEPVYGTPNFGFGAGFEGSKRIWGNKNHNIKINSAINFRYLFQASEHRIAGLGKDNFGHYELLAFNNPDTGTIGLIPAANILNKKVQVTPGCQFDGMLGFGYNNGGFTMDLGYDIYFKEREDVNQCKHYFAPNTYGTASKGLKLNGDTLEVGTGDYLTYGAPSFDSRTNKFGENSLQFDNVADANIPWLSDEDVSMSAAQTPSQFTNSIYAGFGYAFRKWTCPMMLGMGGKYEFAAKNSALEVWQLHGKIGVSF